MEMRNEMLVKIFCEACKTVFLAWSMISHHLDPETEKPIQCPLCGNEDWETPTLHELEVIQVG